jgi:hypothetical protein
MKLKEYIVGDREYLVREDGQIILPAKETTYFRKDHGIWVTRTRKERMSKQSLMKNGYLKSCLGLVHRTVAKAWIGEPPNQQWTVNHKDGNKINNHYTNLEWVAHSDNCKHWIYSDKGIGRKTKPCEGFTLDGKSVGVFNSYVKAAEELGLHKSSVGRCISGRLKKTGGYTFREISKEEYYALQNKTSN